MPRYFTVEEAEALLPSIREGVRRIQAIKASLDDSESALRKTAEKVMFAGGVLLDRAKVSKELAAREVLASDLKEQIQTVQSQGCLIKDLSMGLLDFPTLLRGEEVYLCWKAGEDRIRFWHGVSEGYRGRKPIDEEFLANHRGE